MFHWSRWQHRPRGSVWLLGHIIHTHCRRLFNRRYSFWHGAVHISFSVFLPTKLITLWHEMRWTRRRSLFAHGHQAGWAYQVRRHASADFLALSLGFANGGINLLDSSHTCMWNPVWLRIDEDKGLTAKPNLQTNRPILASPSCLNRIVCLWFMCSFCLQTTTV